MLFQSDYCLRVRSAELSAVAACRISHGRHVALCAVAVVALAGCGSPGEIRQYTVEPENERIVTSDVLKDEFGAIPFEWEAPESWTLARNDQFSKVAWEVGPKVDGGRITVSAVSMGMGLSSQVSHWRGQIGLEQSDQDDPMAGFVVFESPVSPG